MDKFVSSCTDVFLLLMYASVIAKKKSQLGACVWTYLILSPWLGASPPKSAWPP